MIHDREILQVGKSVRRRIRRQRLMSARQMRKALKRAWRRVSASNVG